jgi:hypothetical protein
MTLETAVPAEVTGFRVGVMEFLSIGLLNVTTTETLGCMLVAPLAGDGAYSAAPS